MGERRTYATNRPSGYDGLHETERQVMDLFDRGAGQKNIQVITGLELSSIQSIIGHFSVTALEEWKVDARQGSAALLDALRRVHPQLCGAAS
jgi:hypothetical protein